MTEKKLNLHQLGAFLSEIIFQADLVVNAFKRLNVSIDEFDNIGTWSSIQSILISSSNISKILWPKRKYAQRGEELRILLNIDSKCVLKSRKFRNILEHYDDFIDDFFEDKHSYSYNDFVMNPSLQFLDMSSFHRGYNTFDNTLVIHGEILELNKIIDVVNEVRLKCKNQFL